MSALLIPQPPPLFHSYFFPVLGPCILLNEADACKGGQLGKNNAMKLHTVISMGHSGISQVLGTMPLHNLNSQFENPGEIKTFIKMLGGMAVMVTAGEHFLKGYMEYSLHLYLQEHGQYRTNSESCKVLKPNQSLRKVTNLTDATNLILFEKSKNVCKM